MRDLPRNTIIVGDWIEAAKGLPDGCVQCMITSPPYWGQRDYGVEGQLGLEKTFDEHIEKLVVGFREMKRILRNDGVMFLNYGDKYSTTPTGNFNGGSPLLAGRDLSGHAESGSTRDYTLSQGNLIGLAWRLALALQADGWILRSDIIWAKAVSFNDKYSGSTMPESVSGTRWERCKTKVKNQSAKGKGKQGQVGNSTYTGFNERYFEGAGPQYKDCPGCEKCRDSGGYVLRRGSWRCTRAHEYLFQFVKQIPYYCDMEAVKEDAIEVGDNRALREKNYEPDDMISRMNPRTAKPQGINRNLRDVWTINPKPYAEAHYATFPEALIEPCIKVATSEKGCCPACGAPWARVIDSKQIKRKRPADQTDRHKQCQGVNSCGNTVAGVETQTIGWRPTCRCDIRESSDERRTTPCVVYDPFMGSGTVAAAGARLGRDYLGSELNAEYVERQAVQRIRRAETGLTKQEIDNGQIGLFE